MPNNGKGERHTTIRATLTTTITAATTRINNRNTPGQIFCKWWWSENDWSAMKPDKIHLFHGNDDNKTSP